MLMLIEALMVIEIPWCIDEEEEMVDDQLWYLFCIL
jgi:hypothetical protein